MAKDKDFADRNAHERARTESSPVVPVPDDLDRAAHETDKDEKNPLSRLRFGSAGGGGAEREPGPERP
jgi:hypothetical protein